MTGSPNTMTDRRRHWDARSRASLSQDVAALASRTAQQRPMPAAAEPLPSITHASDLHHGNSRGAGSPPSGQTSLHESEDGTARADSGPAESAKSLSS